MNKIKKTIAIAMLIALAPLPLHADTLASTNWWNSITNFFAPVATVIKNNASTMLVGITSITAAVLGYKLWRAHQEIGKQKTTPTRLRPIGTSAAPSKPAPTSEDASKKSAIEIAAEALLIAKKSTSAAQFANDKFDNLVNILSHETKRADELQNEHVTAQKKSDQVKREHETALQQEKERTAALQTQLDAQTRAVTAAQQAQQAAQQQLDEQQRLATQLQEQIAAQQPGKGRGQDAENAESAQLRAELAAQRAATAQAAQALEHAQQTHQHALQEKEQAAQALQHQLTAQDAAHKKALEAQQQALAELRTQLAAETKKAADERTATESAKQDLAAENLKVMGLQKQLQEAQDADGKTKAEHGHALAELQTQLGLAEKAQQTATSALKDHEQKYNRLKKGRLAVKARIELAEQTLKKDRLAHQQELAARDQKEMDLTTELRTKNEAHQADRFAHQRELESMKAELAAANAKVAEAQAAEQKAGQMLALARQQLEPQVAEAGRTITQEKQAREQAERDLAQAQLRARELEAAKQKQHDTIIRIGEELQLMRQKENLEIQRVQSQLQVALAKADRFEQLCKENQKASEQYGLTQELRRVQAELETQVEAAREAQKALIREQTQALQQKLSLEQQLEHAKQLFAQGAQKLDATAQLEIITQRLATLEAQIAKATTRQKSAGPAVQKLAEHHEKLIEGFRYFTNEYQRLNKDTALPSDATQQAGSPSTAPSTPPRTPKYLRSPMRALEHMQQLVDKSPINKSPQRGASRKSPQPTPAPDRTHGAAVEAGAGTAQPSPKASADAAPTSPFRILLNSGRTSDATGAATAYNGHSSPSRTNGTLLTGVNGKEDPYAPRGVEMATQTRIDINERAVAIKAEVETTLEEVNQLNNKSAAESLKSYRTALDSLNGKIGYIQARENQTFEKLEKGIASNFNRVPGADCTKAYEYLGLDSANAASYSLKDINESRDRYEKQKSDDQDALQKLRQAGWVFGLPEGSDIAKEDYDTYISWKASGKDGKTFNANDHVHIPSAACLKILRALQDLIAEGIQKIVTIQHSIQEQKDKKEREAVADQKLVAGFEHLSGSDVIDPKDIPAASTTQHDDALPATSTTLQRAASLASSAASAVTGLFRSQPPSAANGVHKTTPTNANLPAPPTLQRSATTPAADASSQLPVLSPENAAPCIVNGGATASATTYAAAASAPAANGSAALPRVLVGGQAIDLGATPNAQNMTVQATGNGSVRVAIRTGAAASQD